MSNLAGEKPAQAWRIVSAVDYTGKRATRRRCSEGESKKSFHTNDKKAGNRVHEYPKNGGIWMGQKSEDYDERVSLRIWENETRTEEGEDVKFIGRSLTVFRILQGP